MMSFLFFRKIYQLIKFYLKYFTSYLQEHSAAVHLIDLKRPDAPKLKELLNFENMATSSGSTSSTWSPSGGA